MLNTYLLLTVTQRLPLSSDEPGPLRNSDALEICTRLAFGEEEAPGRDWVLDLAIVFDGHGVRRRPLGLACELPPEQASRVIGETNLFGCVRFDPGIVLGNASFAAFSSQMVEFLSGMSAPNIVGTRAKCVPRAQQA